MIFHGMRTSIVQAVPYDETDYARMKSWGSNCVALMAPWGQLEPYIDQLGVYDEAKMASIIQQIELAKRIGLKVILGTQNSYRMTGAWFAGWPDLPEVGGGDYILNNTDRYANYLRWLADRLPSDVGISIWNFPFHHQGMPKEDPRMADYHARVIPTLYDAVRELTNAPVIVNPMFQGVYELEYGVWATRNSNGVYTFVEDFGWPFSYDRNLYYGYNHKAGDMSLITLQCQDWDYNYDRVNWHYEPLLTFKEKYGLKNFCTTEGFSFDIHENCTLRPIKQSRLDWVRYQFEVMNKNNLGRLILWYRNPPTLYCPMEADGTDSEYATIIKQSTPISPLDLLIRAALSAASGVGLILLSM